MTLSFIEHQKVDEAVSKGLDRAELAWAAVGNKFVKKAMAMDMVRADESVEPSRIPGHPWVTDGTPKVDEFIALVVDMRDSTKRLKTLESTTTIKNGFQRIYYETSALLPAISTVVAFEHGIVTEYLGDGALALFQVNKDDKQASVRSASRAAMNCIDGVRSIINKQLAERYRLPNISLGAGLAIGNALVTLVGSPDNLQPKAIGECVWDASKLSDGRNAVHISQDVKRLWPVTTGGKMQFHPVKSRGVIDGYRLHKG